MVQKAGSTRRNTGIGLCHQLDPERKTPTVDHCVMGKYCVPEVMRTELEEVMANRGFLAEEVNAKVQLPGQEILGQSHWIGRRGQVLVNGA